MREIRLPAMFAWLLLLVVMGGAACGGAAPDAASSPETAPAVTEEAAAIRFTTVAQEAPLGDEPADPAYMAIAKAQGWELAAERLPADAVEAARSVGEQQVAFVAFAGARGSSGYQITIRSIEVRGDELLVTVEEKRPGENENVEPAMTVPYHVVAVAGEAIPQAVTAVRFQDEGGETLAEESYP